MSCHSITRAGNITTVKTYALNDDLTKGTLQSTNTYSYDSVWKDKLASYTENGTVNNLTYDEIGNPINYRDGMVFDWNNGRQLSSITDSDGNTVANFKYNSDGMRTYKDADGEQTYYYYDSNNNLIALDKGGFVAYFYYDSNGQVTSMSFEEILYFFIKNQQGDVEKIVNRLGEVQVSYTYDAWGNVLSVEDDSFYNISRFNPFGYRGYVYDSETGLYYLQSRYYDPQTGRFLNADDTEILMIIPFIGNVLDVNLLTYSYNNPINFTDPSGYLPRWGHLTKAVYLIGKGLIALASALAKGFVRSALGSFTAKMIGVALGLALGAMPLGQWWGTVINVGIIIKLSLQAKSILFDLPNGLWHLKQFIHHNHK